MFGESDIRVLVGCAPCQPYSGLSRKNTTEKEMMALSKFGDLIKEIKPEIISMENVGRLDNEKYPVFNEFLTTLNNCGYHVDYDVVNASNYGVPQNRKRLVLLASLLGLIQIPESKTDRPPTLKQAIGDLPAIKDGEICKSDKLHRARKLSNINKRRIKATPSDGGSHRDWPEELLLDCHKKESGRSFKSVYGRMSWDKPASTMTTQCIGFGNGRFGHPEQNRAISLREAARIQTFPDDYVFYNQSKPINIASIAKFIGNAVPVELGRVLGEEIYKHIQLNYA